MLRRLTFLAVLAMAITTVETARADWVVMAPTSHYYITPMYPPPPSPFVSSPAFGPTSTIVNFEAPYYVPSPYVHQRVMPMTGSPLYAPPPRRLLFPPLLRFGY